MTNNGISIPKNSPIYPKEEIQWYISRDAQEVSTTRKIIILVLSLFLIGGMMTLFGASITGLSQKAILTKHIAHLVIPLIMSTVPIFYAYLTGKIEGEKFAFDILRPWAARGVSSWW